LTSESNINDLFIFRGRYLKVYEEISLFHIDEWGVEERGQYTIVDGTIIIANKTHEQKGNGQIRVLSPLYFDSVAVSVKLPTSSFRLLSNTTDDNHEEYGGYDIQYPATTIGEEVDIGYYSSDTGVIKRYGIQYSYGDLSGKSNEIVYLRDAEGVVQETENGVQIKENDFSIVFSNPKITYSWSLYLTTNSGQSTHWFSLVTRPHPSDYGVIKQFDLETDGTVETATGTDSGSGYGIISTDFIPVEFEARGGNDSYNNIGYVQDIAKSTLNIESSNMTVQFISDKFIGSDIYVDIDGRLSDTPQVPEIISHILNNELGQTGIAETGIYDWKYAFTVDKKINSKKLIEGIGSASPYIPRFDNMGNFRLDVIPIDGGTIGDSDNHHIKEVDVIDFSFSRTPIEQVYTKIEFKYNWDYARGEFNDSVEAEIDDLIDGYDPEYYGFKVDGEYDHAESTLVIDDDRGKYIRNNSPDANGDDATAKAFVEWYLMWSCNQHLKMKIKLPLKYMNLEIGNFVDFDAILGGVKPYGISYTEDEQTVNFQEVFKNFLIVSTNKTLEFCEIECIQMHDLDSGSLNQPASDGDYSDDIDIYEHNIGGVVGTSEKIYNRDLTGGVFFISDLNIKIKSDITAIKEAKIIINAIEYDAEITTDGNTQLLTFFENTPVTIFNVNKMEDMDTHNYIYTFILTTTDLETFNVHRNITYTFNRYSDIGDINGDGQHNILDVVALTDSIIAGNCTDIEDGYPCDLNGDGGYNVLDIVSLANYILSG